MAEKQSQGDRLVEVESLVDGGEAGTPSSTPPPFPPPESLEQPIQIREEKAKEKRNGWIIRFPALKSNEEWRKYAAVRLSTEFDSEDCLLKNKIAAKLLDGLAKVKAVIERNKNGDISCSQVGFVSKYLSVLYDTESRNATFSTTSWLAQGLTVKVNGDVKAQQGEVKLLTNLLDSKYAAEISCGIPSIGLPRTVFKFPVGEVCFQGKAVDEKGLSVSGYVGKKFNNGLWMAEYVNDNLNLRYQYKDEEMTFRPALSIPSKELSFMFARQFNALNKLNMEYNFNSAAWSTVYKFRPYHDFKLKAGYDSSVPLGWVSAWMGREDAGAKGAPGKTKIQLMLQVPPEDVKSSALLIRFKKRWDL